jgi:hypothetical protein
MTLFNYIDPFYFILAFGVGILYCYVTAPPREIIIKYPTPFNQKEVTYTDKAGVCYRYNVTPAACPQDTRKIKQMPLEPQMQTHIPEEPPKKTVTIKSLIDALQFKPLDI